MLLPGPKLRLLPARLCLSVPCYSLSLTPSGILMPQAETIRLSFYNSKHPITKTTGKPLQSYIKVALIGSKPPPQINKACGRCGAPAPHRPHAFPLFWGGGGKRKKNFAKPFLPPENNLQNLHTLGNTYTQER